MNDLEMNPSAAGIQEQGTEQGRGQGQRQGQGGGGGASVNVGENERTVSMVAGAILAGVGISRGSLPGLLIAGVGGALLYRGATGACPMYESLGLNTAEGQEGGTPGERSPEQIASKGVEQSVSFLIGKPAEELYDYWRNFEQLPTFMTHLESVKVIDEKRSHWKAKAPRIYGAVEWDAEIIAEEPGRRIAWRSLPGAEVENAGEVRFEQALGDRGTNVHVKLAYIPPAGKLGHWAAMLSGEAPTQQIKDDLRNFKRLMETGEIPTTVGQPRGTCTGEGKRQEKI